MDVAAFVGFARSGPLDTPVAVEGEAYFREIFGEDQPLAWDPAAGQVRHAYLGPAVRAFFRNGGQRCWVVRIAQNPVTNRFRVPGLAQAAGGGYGPALLQARSPGSWSDSLTVSAVLQAEPVTTTVWSPEPEGPARVALHRLPRSGVRAGDLLRFTWGDLGLVAYLTADQVAQETDYDHPDSGGAYACWLITGRDYWFRTRGPDQPQAVTVQILGEPGDAAGNTATSPEDPGIWLPPTDDGEGGTVLISAELAPSVGDLLRITLSDKVTTGLLSVSEVELASAQHLPDHPVTAQPIAWVYVRGSKVLWPVPSGDGRVQVAQKAAVVERLSLIVSVDDGTGKADRLAQLGFVAGHPRFVGALPTDEELFRPEDERAPLTDGPDPESGLWHDVTGPRFPVAAMAPAALPDMRVYLPIGMYEAARPDVAGSALAQPANWLERDGLAAYSTSLFLDPDLANLPAAAIAAEAFSKRHVRLEKLKGVHAVWPLEEATLLCVPDLVQTGWEPEGPPPLLAPYAPELKADLAGGQLAWTAVDQARDYVLEESADPTFETLTSARSTKALALPIPPGRLPAVRRYFRVRGQQAGQIGPWSNTVSVLLPRPDFSPLDELQPPELTAQTWGLQWSGDDGDRFVLQYSLNADFQSPTALYEGPLRTYQSQVAGRGPCFYRVRAVRDGGPGPWSNTLTLNAPEQPATNRWRVLDLVGGGVSDDLQQRTRIHRSLLQLCRARGDLFAVLSLPSSYQDNDVTLFARALSSLVGPEEEGALGYGALYHPWLWLETSPGERLLVPPDGAVTGLIANRALARGAWSPPANQLVRGGLGLHHASLGRAVAPLLSSGVNRMSLDPDGLRVVTAHTLHPRVELQAINVRRLLMLIRRLVMREGAQLVFQPNDANFRQMAQRRFEILLTDLFVRGAFAGSTPAESFMVSVDPAVNTPNLAERGQVIIDLKVAPARPLTFMTIRLVQELGAAPAVSEV